MQFTSLCLSEKEVQNQECAEETKTPKRRSSESCDVMGSHMLACRCRSFRGVQPLGAYPSTFRIHTGASACISIFERHLSNVFNRGLLFGLDSKQCLVDLTSKLRCISFVINIKPALSISVVDFACPVSTTYKASYLFNIIFQPSSYLYSFRNS